MGRPASMTSSFLHSPVSARQLMSAVFRHFSARVGLPDDSRAVWKMAGGEKKSARGCNDRKEFTAVTAGCF